MTEGTNKGLLIVVAIVIFGIFVWLSYILFDGNLSPAIGNIFDKGIEIGKDGVNNNGSNGNNGNGGVNVGGGSNSDIDDKWIADSKPTAENMFVFDDETQTITNYIGTASDVHIPNKIRNLGVLAIGASAFNRDPAVKANVIGVDLTSVIIPDTVETIYRDAFRGNPSKPTLSKLKLGNSIETITEYSFGYNHLKNVSIPNSVKNLVDFSFYNDKPTIEKLSLGNGVEYIGGSSFENHKLENLKIPDSVSGIYAPAFRSKVPTLKHIDFGKNITQVSENAFEGNGIEELYIPKNLIYLYSTAFKNSGTLKKVVFEDADVYQTFWKFNDYKEFSDTDNPFYGSKPILEFEQPFGTSKDSVGTGATIIGYRGFDKNVVIPSTVNGKTITEINYAAMSNSEESIGMNSTTQVNIESVVIPNTVKVIDVHAFAQDLNNRSLKKVTIGNSVESIRFEAFRNSLLTEITIPKSVKVLNGFAFVGTTELKTVYIQNSEGNIKIETDDTTPEILEGTNAKIVYLE